MNRLAGKVALITGAGSGLGRASALRFAAEGASVACCDIDGAAAETTRAHLVGAEGRAVAVAADVTSEADCDRMVAEAVDAFGAVDVVFANAGINGTGRAGELSLDAWQRVIAVNLTGVWLSCRAAIRQFLAQRRAGTLIATASVGGMIGIANIAPYAAAKAGVIGLTRQIAVDYGPEGIRMNAICPGSIPTPLTRRSYEERIGVPPGEERSVDDLLTASLQSRYPLRRLGTEADVAEAAVYLASDESSWVNGTTLVVDGGLTAG